MGIEDARFEAYLEAVRRSRWFILATVILSSLILCHVYLERVSLQTAALQGVIAHRIKNQTEETLRDMEKKLEGEVDECVKQKNAIPKDLDVRLEAFAENKFTYIVTQNELNNTRLEKRSLPFLGLEIPSDDYLPIMSVMLAIFAVGVVKHPIHLGIATKRRAKRTKGIRTTCTALFHVHWCTGLETTKSRGCGRPVLRIVATICCAYSRGPTRSVAVDPSGSRFLPRSSKHPGRPSDHSSRGLADSSVVCACKYELGEAC